MKKNDEAQQITLLELAQQIMALPPEQQAQKAYYEMIDDRGYHTYEAIFGLEIQKGEVAVEGVDQTF